MNKALLALALVIALVHLPTVQSGQCQACPNRCSSCYYSGNNLVIVSAQSGYSIDQQNGLCYQTCSGNQFYNPSSMQCQNCPNGCTSCRFINGTFTIQTSSNGYSIDNQNGICYPSCVSSQYYDPNQQKCVNCPCGTCNYYNGRLQILTSPAGYQIDSINNVCYPNCISGQYYDYSKMNCQNCPQFCTSCYVSTTGLIVNAAQYGYSIDSVASMCYPTCSSNQYYDWKGMRCVNCPNGCSTCKLVNETVVITSYPKGYVVDTWNNLCYPQCTSNQYYNPLNMQCQFCPTNCTTCTWQFNQMYILTASVGYSIDNVNGLCYQTCGKQNYWDYRPF